MATDERISHSDTIGASTADEEALNELTEQLSKFNWKDGVVDRAKHLLYSNDIQENVKGVLSLKAMLCIGRDEVYEVAQEVIDSGVISRLVYFLSIDDKELQWPSAFCLTNIAAGHDAQTQIVVKAGAIPPLVAFLRHPDGQLRRQAIFCLANVAGSTREYRKMLATYPDYFPSIFHAGNLSSDARVLELVCWNLRNVCLLGGPTFLETKPGVEYLLNSILKRYLHYPYWAGCVRYAIETITAVCRIEEGRQFMIEEELMQCLTILIENMSCISFTIAQSTFEACAWLLAYGSIYEKQLFARAYGRTYPAIDEALQGTNGQTIQELALKCLTYMGSEPDKELLLSFLDTHHFLLHLLAQLFMELLLPIQNIESSKNNRKSSAEQTTACSTVVKECAGYLFVQFLSLIRYIPELNSKMYASPEVVKVVLDILEFAADQLRMKQYGGSLMNAASPSAMRGPPLKPQMSEMLLTSTLYAISEHIANASSFCQVEEFLQNPVLSMYNEHELLNRVQNILSSIALPEDGYHIANKLLSQC